MEKDVKTKEKKAVKSKKVTEEVDSVFGIYEISYILLPSLSNDDVSKEVTNLQEQISSNSGNVLSFENPILIDLAYPMVKVTTSSRVKCQKGYFGYIKFQMDTLNVSEIKKYAENNPFIVRFLIVKTVKENTLLNGKMMFKKEDKVSKDETVDDVKSDVIDEVALDKSIDNLVVA